MWGSKPFNNFSCCFSPECVLSNPRGTPVVIVTVHSSTHQPQCFEDLFPTVVKILTNNCIASVSSNGPHGNTEAETRTVCLGVVDQSHQGHWCLSWRAHCYLIPASQLALLWLLDGHLCAVSISPQANQALTGMEGEATIFMTCLCKMF